LGGLNLLSGKMFNASVLENVLNNSAGLLSWVTLLAIAAVMPRQQMWPLSLHCLLVDEDGVSSHSWDACD